MIGDVTKDFIKLGAVLIAVAWLYQAYGDWSDERAEQARRKNLTSSQRQAEDAAAANQRAQEDAFRALEAKEAPFRSTCRNALFSSLHDPSSASIDYKVGWFNAEGVYTGVFEGRAKNMMGAYVLAAWDCTAQSNAGQISVTGIKQRAK